jgi:aspartate 4-decarboxylase
MLIEREQKWLQELADRTDTGQLDRREFFRLAIGAGLSLAAASSMLGIGARETWASERGLPEASGLRLKNPGFTLPKHNYLLDKESPFEVKNILIEKAKKASQGKGIPFINVGRGNPDFLNPTPRQAFAQIVHFAAQTADELDPAQDFGYRVHKKGLAAKLQQWLHEHHNEPGTAFLDKAMAHLQKLTGGDPDELVFQVVDAANGDFYPDPGRILPFTETAVRGYLNKVLFGGKPPKGQFKLFATEGATASMIYVFASLKALKVLKQGDKVAIFTPTFSPYLEVPRLSEFGLKEVFIPANEKNNWHVDQDQIRKVLKDPQVKALYLINPANPGAVALSRQTVETVAEMVKKHNPNLIVINDTVYANFVEEFHTLAELIPENTIGCYSFSKYYGVTGWRLGIVALYENCVVDRILADLPKADKKALRERYSIASTDPDSIPYYLRIEMESRDVALAHTGGLSCPQQVIMALFSLFEVLDEQNTYKKTITGVIKERWDALYKGLEIPAREGNDLTRYYAVINIKSLAETRHGKDFSEWISKQWDVGFLFHLAEDWATVCLPGDGFAGPDWSLRIATANQSKESCLTVGKNIVTAVDTYYKYYKKS